jgi:hypothetical protein
LFDIVGVFVDAFPNPSGGFHFGGLFGGSAYRLQDQFDGDRQSTGWGAAGWVGYGFWIGSEWSLGGIARVSGGITKSTFDMPIQNTATSVDEQASSKAFSILFTALYH